MQRARLISSFRVLALTLFAAAFGSKAAPAKDPHAPATEPAVVAVPTTLPVDTMQAALGTKPKPTVVPTDGTARQVAASQVYSLAAATMVFKDSKMLGQLYMPDATLMLPDSTARGLVAVVRAWSAFATTQSLSDFQRVSQGTRVVDDSTVADSGTYVMTFKRTPKDSVIQRGRYATTFRVRPGASGWLLLSERITPAKGSKK